MNKIIHQGPHKTGKQHSCWIGKDLHLLASSSDPREMGESLESLGGTKRDSGDQYPLAAWLLLPLPGLLSDTWLGFCPAGMWLSCCLGRQVLTVSWNHLVSLLLSLPPAGFNRLGRFEARLLFLQLFFSFHVPAGLHPSRILSCGFPEGWCHCSRPQNRRLTFYYHLPYRQPPCSSCWILSPPYQPFCKSSKPLDIPLSISPWSFDLHFHIFYLDCTIKSPASIYQQELNPFISRLKLFA